MIDACPKCLEVHTTINCPSKGAPPAHPKLIEPNPVMLQILKLYLEKYELLGDYDRGLYRMAIEFFVRPPMTVAAH